MNIAMSVKYALPKGILDNTPRYPWQHTQNEYT